MKRSYLPIRLIIRGVICTFLCQVRPCIHAAEFEILDRFSVDGYSVLKGSADIPGGNFTVGGSTLVVKGGNVGIGTAAPGARLDVQGMDTQAYNLTVGTSTAYSMVVSTNGKVDIHDPWVKPEEVMHEYALTCLPELNGNRYEAIILAVAHQAFSDLDIRSLCFDDHTVVYDVKGVLPKEEVDGRL